MVSTQERQIEDAVIAPPDRDGEVRRAVDSRLVMVRTKLPFGLSRRLAALAAERKTSLYALMRSVLERALEGPLQSGEMPSKPPAQPQGGAPLGGSRRISVHLALDDIRRTEAYAAREGVRTGLALAHLLRLGLETAEEREGIPASRADEITSVLHVLETLVSHVGLAALGTQVLLAYWVAKASGGKVDEDELLQQARRVGEDEWARVLEDLRHEPRVED